MTKEEKQALKEAQQAMIATAITTVLEAHRVHRAAGKVWSKAKSEFVKLYNDNVTLFKAAIAKLDAKTAKTVRSIIEPSKGSTAETVIMQKAAAMTLESLDKLLERLNALRAEKAAA